MQSLKKPVIRTGSKNFYLASQFLPDLIKNDIWTLYAFLRYVDDIADGALGFHDQRDVAQGARVLQAVRWDITSGKSDNKIVADFVELVRRTAIGQNLIDELFAGLYSDLGTVRYQTIEQLTDYCFQVAGTVGLMLLKIIDLNDFRARSYASDLGIGMQLTNIARDVLEDAALDRVYLPADLVSADTVFLAVHGARCAQIEVYRSIRELLTQAEQYYRSADHGMGFLPLSCRLSFLTASRLYESISEPIKSHGSQKYFGSPVKIRTSRLTKARALANAFYTLVCDSKYRSAFCKGQDDVGVSVELSRYTQACYE